MRVAEITPRICCAFLLAAVPCAAQQLEVLPVQGNVLSCSAYAGGNITLQIGDSGVLVVDTGLAPMSDRVIAEIRKLSNKPLRYVVNTDVKEDHTGGNEAFSREFGSFDHSQHRQHPRRQRHPDYCHPRQ